MIDAAPAATLYWRPTAFIDAPFGLDGQFARLAGGALYFSAWDVTARIDGRRTGQWLISID
ncbi:MAG: dihydropteroate synthase, partial [Pseudomonadota bacterium]